MDDSRLSGLALHHAIGGFSNYQSAVCAALGYCVNDPRRFTERIRSDRANFPIGFITPPVLASAPSVPGRCDIAHVDGRAPLSTSFFLLNCDGSAASLDSGSKLAGFVECVGVF